MNNMNISADGSLKIKKLLFIVYCILFTVLNGNVSFAQQKPLTVSDPYLTISADATDPLYTTYTAAMDRSRFYGDKGYKMDYYSDCFPVNYAGDQAGKMFAIWKVDKVVVNKVGEYFKKPVVRASFPDMAILEYEPFEGVRVTETFMVYSSSIALVDFVVENTDKIPHEVEIYPVLELGKEALVIRDYDSKNNGYITYHYETKKRLISNLYAKAPYPEHCRDIFTASVPPYSYGGYTGTQEEFYNTIKRDFYSDNKSDSLNLEKTRAVDFIALHNKFMLKPGESTRYRYFRGWQAESEDIVPLQAEIEKLKTADLQPLVDANVTLFSRIPRIDFKSEDEKLVYLGAFNLVRGSMLPPADKTKYNFYVFSRNPLWGWGHGHQVLHESLSMLSYVYLDPKSAQESQRIYMEQQREDGLIAYRHGPRGLQDYPHEEMSTTSAPFFSWINWEIFKVSKDQTFLQDAYTSGVKYMDWLLKNRDVDKDKTFEWGPYGIIENVRDWYNAVFQVSADRYLDVDKEDISDELECLDLTAMIIKEMRCLAEMATSLGKTDEAANWSTQADEISAKVNTLMWDEKSQFYYSVNRDDHSFFYLTRDLRRQEIIGFLPMWAKAAPNDRAATLVKTLQNPDKFWRTYGVPTLAADDVWYSPYVDYCCKWNGPVWLLWDYMVIDGLREYGYKEAANELSDKLVLAVATQLSKNHNYWESYSPDNTVLNSPSNYIWDAIMAKVLIDKYTLQ